MLKGKTSYFFKSRVDYSISIPHIRIANFLLEHTYAI